MIKNTLKLISKLVAISTSAILICLTYATVAKVTFSTCSKLFYVKDSVIGEPFSFMFAIASLALLTFGIIIFCKPELKKLGIDL